MLKKAMGSIIPTIRKLEGLGTRTMGSARTMSVTGGRAKKMAAPFVGSAGRTMNYFGRNPYTAVALGGAAVGAGVLKNRQNTPVMGLRTSDMTRQNTMYNKKMRAGQSTAIGGLIPRSTGGYA